ncbi:MAG TPA: DnaA/Hda family protein [Albidovulum sp.]|uniref:AAA family ATPase n=1 Tax=Albidovulum sp. TaxID=1872424 RepID=UPI002D132B40|nr:DnaA/Hda family protein [Albidovulum sp.]
MPRQLAFDLPVRPALGRGDFFVAPANALAVAALDRTENWPGGKMLLVGPPGAGKTHLAHVWAARTGAMVLEADQVGAADLPDAAALVIEDAPRVAGRRELETALFHLHNHMAQRRGLLLMTADRVVRDWGIALADLKSRMEATATATLSEPDNELLGAVLVKLFADRQLAVSPGLIRWLLGRMNRSFATARDIVAALDAAALARRRPITRDLAAELLDSHGNVTS